MVRHVFCLGAILAAGALHAQLLRGSVQGTITDATGSVIVGTHVTLH